MEVLLRMKPKVEPYVMMIGAAALIVIVVIIALAVMFSDYAYYVVIAGVGVLLLLALLVMQQFYRKWYTTYEITEHDVIWRFGVFAPDEEVVPIDEITNMKINRSFLGIIFGFADLEIDTASAKMDYEIIMKDIDAKELDKAVELLRSSMKERGVGRRMRMQPPGGE
ncbi:MAG: PH domain-containing protein [Candidatus Micrarchaeia archaeon]